MMNTVRKSENLLPFPVISAAANGDTNAMCAILKHYGGYIAKLCTRTLKDDAGNTYSYVDEAEFSRKRETLSKAETRIAELDNLFKHLYEDNVTGKLSDERFIKMSHDYELEQSNLKAMAEVLREEIKQQEKQKTNVKAFIGAVKKYTDMQQLDAAMLREFIDRIEVSHTDKKSKTREITIVYNFIGAFDFERAKEKAQNTTEKQQRTA